MIARTNSELICDMGTDVVGADLHMTTDARAVMPCGCEIICGTQDGEQAALAITCDSEHDEVLEEAVKTFCFAGELERANDLGREDVEIANDAMKHVFGEAGLPVR